jgi:hypothetical protein
MQQLTVTETVALFVTTTINTNNIPKNAYSSNLSERKDVFAADLVARNIRKKTTPGNPGVA